MHELERRTLDKFYVEDSVASDEVRYEDVIENMIERRHLYNGTRAVEAVGKEAVRLPAKRITSSDQRKVRQQEKDINDSTADEYVREDIDLAFLNQFDSDSDGQ